VLRKDTAGRFFQHVNGREGSGERRSHLSVEDLILVRWLDEQGPIKSEMMIHNKLEGGGGKINNRSMG